VSWQYILKVIILVAKMTPKFCKIENCSCEAMNSPKKTFTSTALVWLGFYGKCTQCGKYSTKTWNSTNLLLFISSILCLQVIISLLTLPIIKHFISLEISQMVYFLSIHVLLLPMYLKAGFYFLVLTHQQ
jgi:hypothetical protein